MHFGYTCKSGSAQLQATFTAGPQAATLSEPFDTSDLQVGRPKTGSGSGAGRARLVSARLPDHAAARGALLDLALGALAALHEAELAPEELPALDTDAPGPGAARLSTTSHALSAMRPDGEGLEARFDGDPGTAGGLQSGQGSDRDVGPTETLALRPRSVAAALAAPELRCRAAWFRELLRSEDGAEPYAAALRSLVDALEVRMPVQMSAGISLGALARVGWCTHKPVSAGTCWSCVSLIKASRAPRLRAAHLLLTYAM